MTGPPVPGSPLAGIIGEGDDDGRMYHDGGYGREWMRTPGPLGRLRAAAAAWAGRVAAGRWAGAPGIAQGTAQAELVAFVPRSTSGSTGWAPWVPAPTSPPSAGSRPPAPPARARRGAPPGGPVRPRPGWAGSREPPPSSPWPARWST